MNQNNLTDLENLKNLKYRSSVLMPNTDYELVKKLKTRLNRLGYETVVHSEAFWDGY